MNNRDGDIESHTLAFMNEMKLQKTALAILSGTRSRHKTFERRPQAQNSKGPAECQQAAQLNPPALLRYSFGLLLSLSSDEDEIFQASMNCMESMNATTSMEVVDCVESTVFMDRVAAILYSL